MQTSYFARLDHINSQRGFGNMTDRKFKRRPDLKRCRVHGAVWRFLLVLGVCTACFVPGAGAESTYALDQKFGSIDFSVDNVGLFTSEGQFKRFQASLTIDEAHPERTSINVDVDAGSVDMPWEDGVKMLRSADYFDVQNFPRVQFKSLTVQALTRTITSSMAHWRSVGLRNRACWMPEWLGGIWIRQRTAKLWISS